MKVFTSFSVNPLTSSSVSQYFRTLTPASCRAVATTRQFGSTRPWIICENIGSFFSETSSNPSSTRRTLDWLWRMKSKNLSRWSSSTSRGRSWSLMASQRSDSTSRHLTKSTIRKFEKQFPVACFPVAQSTTTLLQYVVFPIPGFPSINTTLGSSHSSCWLKISGIVTTRSVAVPLVFSLKMTLSLV